MKRSGPAALPRSAPATPDPKRNHPMKQSNTGSSVGHSLTPPDPILPVPRTASPLAGLAVRQEVAAQRFLAMIRAAVRSRNTASTPHTEDAPPPEPGARPGAVGGRFAAQLKVVPQPLPEGGGAEAICRRSIAGFRAPVTVHPLEGRRAGRGRHHAALSNPPQSAKLVATGVCGTDAHKRKKRFRQRFFQKTNRLFREVSMFSPHKGGACPL